MRPLLTLLTVALAAVLVVVAVSPTSMEQVASRDQDEARRNP